LTYKHVAQVCQHQLSFLFVKITDNTNMLQPLLPVRQSTVQSANQITRKSLIHNTATLTNETLSFARCINHVIDCQA